MAWEHWKSSGWLDGSSIDRWMFAVCGSLKLWWRRESAEKSSKIKTRIKMADVFKYVCLLCIPVDNSEMCKAVSELEAKNSYWLISVTKSKPKHNRWFPAVTAPPPGIYQSNTKRFHAVVSVQHHHFTWLLVVGHKIHATHSKGNHVILYIPYPKGDFDNLGLRHALKIDSRSLHLKKSMWFFCLFLKLDRERERNLFQHPLGGRKLLKQNLYQGKCQLTNEIHTTDLRTLSRSGWY